MCSMGLHYFIHFNACFRLQIVNVLSHNKLENLFVSQKLLEIMGWGRFELSQIQEFFRKMVECLRFFYEVFKLKH